MRGVRRGPDRSRQSREASEAGTLRTGRAPESELGKAELGKAERGRSMVQGRYYTELGEAAQCAASRTRQAEIAAAKS